VRVNPQWHVMRQGFSFRNVHGKQYLISRLAGKPKLVGTDRWAVPVRNEVEDGTNVARLASRRCCPAEEGEAPDSGQRSALSLPRNGLRAVGRDGPLGRPAARAFLFSAGRRFQKVPLAQRRGSASGDGAAHRPYHKDGAAHCPYREMDKKKSRSVRSGSLETMACLN
jgi:hypothetical protein